MSDLFLCEGCGEPLSDDLLVDGYDADDLDFQEEAAMSNMPGCCPYCSAVQWDRGGY